MKSFAAVTLAALAAATLVPAAVAAEAKPPTKAQKAEARAVMAATRAFGAGIPTAAPPQIAVDGCRSIVSAEERNSLPADAEAVFEETFAELYTVDLLQAVAPQFRAYKTRLASLRLKDPILRRGRAGIVHQLNVFLGFAAVPPVDACAALAAWKAAGWPLDARPTTGANLAGFDQAKFEAAQTAVRTMQIRLVAFGQTVDDVLELLGLFTGG